jgi:hypothetical protein
MKNLNKALLGAAIAATLSLANTASAQYTPTGDDGITASPKVRQMLDERAASSRIAPANTTVAVTYRNPADGITASPKVRQMLAERRVVVSGAASIEVAAAGYRPTGADSITASPKLREQLNARSTAIMVAPLK